jgi:benzoyl-CoA reductase/2-hydroxyglutaryl-CoA dehydratase subunit BcrC/BadD/HgdB
LVGHRLLNTSFEETIGLIQGFGGFGKEKKLIESVSQNKLTTEKLHKTIEKFQRLLEKGESLN